MSKKKTLNLVIGCTLSAVFLYLAFRNVEFHKLAGVLKSINYWWTIPFVIITVLGMYVRAMRWRWFLKPRYDFSSWRLFSPVSIGFALNSLLPLRAGEFARPFVLARREKIPYSTVFATVVVERIVDSVTLLTSFFVVLLFVKIDPAATFKMGKYTVSGAIISSATHKFALLIFLLVIGAILLIISSTRIFLENLIRRMPLLPMSLKEKVVAIFTSFSQGFHSLRSGKVIAIVFLYSVVVWCLVGFSLQVMAFGFPGLSLSFFQGMAVMIIICVAILIPAAPGYWGLYECGGIFALKALGAGRGSAMALGFSLLIHFLQVIPIIIIGIIFMWKENVSLSQIERLTESKDEKASPD